MGTEKTKENIYMLSWFACFPILFET